MFKSTFFGIANARTGKEYTITGNKSLYYKYTDYADLRSKLVYV